MSENRRGDFFYSHCREFISFPGRVAQEATEPHGILSCGIIPYSSSQLVLITDKHDKSLQIILLVYRCRKNPSSGVLFVVLCGSKFNKATQ